MKVLILFLGSLASCITFFSQGEGLLRYKIGSMKDAASFVKYIQDYEKVQGVLPDTFWSAAAKNNTTGDFVYTSASLTHEFFVFNKKRLLILLSLRPLYFFEIESPLFYLHCLSQFLQIKSGRLGGKKSIYYAPFFKQLGNIWADIYFGPKEISFGTQGNGEQRLRQTGNQRPRIDIWRLIEAAQEIEAYFPHFEDQKMHEDFIEQIEAGKSRKVFADKFLFSEGIPSYGREKKGHPFTFIFGHDLEITDNLLDGQAIEYLDAHELVRDFLAVFSLPPGNPRALPLLNSKDSIVILIRGNLSYFKKFLSQRSTLDSYTEEPLQKDSFIISEVGNKTQGENANDYVVLYNPSDSPLSLGGLSIGRDKDCKLENGWGEFQALPPILVPAKSYFLLGREENSLDADWIWNGSLTSRYCIAIGSSSIPPESLEAASTIDALHFTDLRDGDAYRRKGACSAQDSDSFADDFEKITSPQMPKNSQSPPCMR